MFTIARHKALTGANDEINMKDIHVHVKCVWLALLVSNVNARTLRKALLPHNLALNRPATESSNNLYDNAELAVDGNYNDSFNSGSCTHTDMAPDQWWMVDLVEEFLVYEVHVQNRGDCCYERLADVNILVGMTPSAMELCYHFDGPGVPGYYEFHCNERLPGRYVKLYKYSNSALTLCEVVVLGTYPNDDLPYNLALQMETTVSAFDADGGLAVDGNGNPDAAFCTQIISSSYDQWWMVDLDRKYLITAVGVQNRGDCCGDHFADVDVLVGMEVPRFRLCDHYDGPGADSEYIPFICARRIRGRFVKVVKHGGQPLTLCEVVVRGTLLSASGDQGEFSSHTGVRGISASTSPVEGISSPIQCTRLCLSNPDCEGFNFVTYTNGSATCELLLASFETTASPDWTLYTLE